MKRTGIVCSIVLLTISAFAQVPDKMSYQLTIRDASELASNQSVGIQANVVKGVGIGTIVYTETHTVMTNANGLASIELGNGTPVNGDFTAIDWTDGPYSVRTETDPAGGTDYIITITSELTSVPYALHAGTADQIAGGFIEADPVFVASVARDITTDYINNWNNKLSAEVDGSVSNELQTISRTGRTVTLSNGGGTYTDSINIYTAGTGIEIKNNVVRSTLTPQTYQVGDFAQGGIVFWIDATGQHGLVCTKTDLNAQGTGVRWYAGTFGITHARGDGPLSGKTNTAIAIAANTVIGNDGAQFAARLCNELQVTEDGSTYGNWYLPSREELGLIYQQKATINATAVANGGIAINSGIYWSSTEIDSQFAWSYNLGNGTPFNIFNKESAHSVRAVRAF